MKKKYKIICMIGMIGIITAVSIWCYVRPKALGNINHSYSEPETSVSEITFQGEVGDKIRFSLSSNIRNGDLDIIVYDSKGNAVKELDKADKLVVLWDLDDSDTYTLAVAQNEFIGDFKVNVYKEGPVKLSCWIF